MLRRTLWIIVALWLCAIGAIGASAQEQEQPQAPPFEYPVAPDTCSTLESRCNYIVQHFWDNYDISKPITDLRAFHIAFRDFVGFFRHAHRNVVKSAIRDFMFKAQSNASNLSKIGFAVDMAVYGPTSVYWSDEVYVAFITPLARSKQLPENEQKYYKRQLEIVNRYQVGNDVNFEFTDITGAKRMLSDVPAKYMLIYFTDDGTDSSIGRVRLSSDLQLNSLMEAGEITVVEISFVDYSAEWAAKDYPQGWTVGCNTQLAKELDLRFLPCCYLLSEGHKLAHKCITVDAIKDFLRGGN